MISDQALDTLKTLSGAFLDGYVLLNRKQKLIDFNRVFHSYFPRNIARQLKRKTLAKVLTLELAGEPIDLPEQCMAKGKPLRYDEIIGRIGSDLTRNLLIAGVPLFNNKQEVTGAFVCLRDVTDEAQVQSKYKQMLDQEAHERELLQQRIQEAETELIQVKDHLNSVEKELIDYKKGLLI